MGYLLPRTNLGSGKARDELSCGRACVYLPVVRTLLLAAEHRSIWCAISTAEVLHLACHRGLELHEAGLLPLAVDRQPHRVAVPDW